MAQAQIILLKHKAGKLLIPITSAQGYSAEFLLFVMQFLKSLAPARKNKRWQFCKENHIICLVSGWWTAMTRIPLPISWALISLWKLWTCLCDQGRTEKVKANTPVAAGIILQRWRAGSWLIADFSPWPSKNNVLKWITDSAIQNRIISFWGYWLQ